MAVFSPLRLPASCQINGRVCKEWRQDRPGKAMAQPGKYLLVD
ncbi:hypothetical protein HMPREF0731_3285 [Pseudoroseomonas cervicalis ATCC 49957]|uniref:Uncharacterized protein n=1 Tax=Pseudoroseomonas cervicalis ATCC 49957 TaxID=525371 RepID=D5RQC3_9PROT|nr:hypothetical protein HMPREF0731_3285 [Pseudoroseomonas cervicalis ATCC 49957]